MTNKPAQHQVTIACFHMYMESFGQRTNGYKNSLKETGKEMKLQDPSPKIISPVQEQDIAYGEALVLSQQLNKNPKNLVLISDYVEKHKGAKISLQNTEVTHDVYIRICGLDGTIYAGETYELGGWEELYLPEPTKMEVYGVLESYKGMIPFPQWIVLVGEDGHVYGYADKVLHLFANSLKELLHDGIKKTGVYYEYPEDLSDVEEEVLQQDKEIQERRQKTREFIDEDADEFNDFLDSF